MATDTDFLELVRESLLNTTLKFEFKNFNLECFYDMLRKVCTKCEFLWWKHCIEDV